VHNLYRERKRLAEYMLIAFSPAIDATINIYQQLNLRLAESYLVIQVNVVIVLNKLNN